MKYHVSVQYFWLFYILFIVLLSVVKSVSYIAIVDMPGVFLNLFFLLVGFFSPLQFIC